MKRSLLLLALGLACQYLAGCANHLDPETTTEHKVDRVEVSHQLDIETSAKETITEPVVDVAVQEASKFHIKEMEGSTQYDVYTPYQGWRELYEVPMGVVLLPVAVVINLADFLTLGLIPNSATDTVLDWSFAGMNPFLNIESKTRTERSVIKQELKPLDEKDEYIKQPVANADLTVVAHGVRYDKKTDANGKARINMLELSQFDDGLDVVEFDARTKDITAKEELNVSRQLSARLLQASLVLKKYPAGEEKATVYPNGGTADTKALANDVAKLSQLGFEKESRKLEQAIMGVLREDDKAAFSAALNTELSQLTLH